ERLRRRRHRFHAAMTMTGLTFACVLSFAAWKWFTSVASRPMAGSTGRSLVATRDKGGRDILELADGSRAVLLAGAHVRALEQSRSWVLLEQTSGEVRYEVKRKPSRAFEVKTPKATVHVVGTVFTVSVHEDEVHVRVIRGHVRVNQPHRAVMLSTREEVRI